MTDLGLRLFQPADAEELTDLLHRAYAEWGAMGLNFTAIDQSVETTLFRASGGATWVAVREGALAGTITISRPPGNQLQTLSTEARIAGRVWLNQLAVDPGLRHLGLASRLWATGKRWAMEHEATAIGVDTAEPATQLIELYAHWGFTRRETIQWPGKRYQSAVMVLDL